jgi:hypothetical protein
MEHHRVRQDALAERRAPFRAFVKHIYGELGGWQGQVRLYHGAMRGIELAYMNDQNADLKYYYDEETFKAFQAVSPRPHFDVPVDLEGAIAQNGEEVWALLQDPRDPRLRGRAHADPRTAGRGAGEDRRLGRGLRAAEGDAGRGRPVG